MQKCDRPFLAVVTIVLVLLTSSANSRAAIGEAAPLGDIDRLVVTTWYVSPTGNDADTCRAATSACRTINAALAKAAVDDIVRLAAGVYREAVVAARDVTLIGVGPAHTIIDGDNTHIPLTVQSGAGVSVFDLTIQHGTGGIDNFGTVALWHVSVQHNQAETQGGAITNYGVLLVNSSAIHGNRSAMTAGIHNNGELEMTNSTISGNQATAKNAVSALWNTGTGQATLTNVTITANQGTDRALYTTGVVQVQNSIIAANTGYSDCGRAFQGTIQSLGNNLDGGTSCWFDAPGDQENVDPRLGPLQPNGGSTLTHALLPGSPAIDHGSSSGCPAEDQRDAPRPVDGNRDGIARCDIGAYEVSAALRGYLPMIRR